jgi:hypothetical protein
MTCKWPYCEGVNGAASCARCVTNCPFCEGPSEIQEISGGTWRIHCTVCNAEVSDWTEAGVLAKWNRRATLSALTAEAGKGEEAPCGLARILDMEFYLHEDVDSEADVEPVRLVMAMSFGNKVYCHRITQGDNGICRDDTLALSTATPAGEWVSFEDRWPPKSPALDDPSVATTDRVLVTNNLAGRDRMGRMSHVWLCAPIQDKREIVGFTESNSTIYGLTHWHPLPAPLAASPRGAGESGHE